MNSLEKLERAYAYLNDFVSEMVKPIFANNDMTNYEAYSKAKEFCETLEKQNLYAFVKDPDVGHMIRNAGYCIIDRIRSDFPELDPLADISGNVEGKFYDGKGGDLVPVTVSPVEHRIDIETLISDDARLIVETDYAVYSYQVVERDLFVAHAKHRPHDKLFYIATKAKEGICST